MKSAVEIYGGYDNNPARFVQPKGSSFYKSRQSCWPQPTGRGTRSSWISADPSPDMRSSFSAAPFQTSPAPENVDRAEFNGKIAGRLDVARDLRVNSEMRNACWCG